MAMAMASVGHKNISLPDGMFVLGGKTFHRVGSLVPADAAQHAFAQIYLLDTEQATDRRVDVLGGRDAQTPLRRDVLSQLHRLMLQYNPCVQQFVAAARDHLPLLVPVIVRRSFPYRTTLYAAFTTGMHYITL
jgi:hypothetical protein